MNRNTVPRQARSFWAMPVDRLFINRAKRVAHGYTMAAEHAHEYYEMVFNFSRIPIRYTVSGHSFASDTPGVLFRAPYVLHSINTEHIYVRTMLAFHPCILSEYGNVLDLGRLQGRHACMIPRTEEQMEKLDQILLRMEKNWREEYSEKVFVCLLGALLHEVSSLIPEEQLDRISAPPYIQDLMHYIVAHTDEALTADILAKKYFVGKTKLAADFFAVTRQTLHEYVTAVRVSRAKYWLAEGVPLSIIAERCGFSQDASFIAMFRRETGMTPGQWRESGSRP